MLNKTLNCLLVLGVIASAPTSIFAVSFEYTYQRPDGLFKRLPQELPLLVPVVGPTEKVPAGREKARRLARALGIDIDSQSFGWSTDKYGEILRAKNERYRFKVYLPSGAVKFRDTVLHNQDPPPGTPGLSSDEALDLAGDVLQALVEARLVLPEELLFESNHVYFREGGVDSRPVEDGAPEVLEKSTIQDARVFIPRAIRGVGVSGHGVRMIFSNFGKLTGLDLLWRDVIVEPSSNSEVELDMRQAKESFEEIVDVPQNSRVLVKVSELVYFDPSKRDSVNFLEPQYLFVYEVRVPVEGDDLFRVSKLLHQRIPAIAHNRQQLSSTRQQRLTEIALRLDQPRPRIIPEVDENHPNDEVEAANLFDRSDCDGSGAGDVSDGIFQLVFLFVGGVVPPCLSACDTDGNGTVAGDLGDPIYWLTHLLIGGPPPPEPYGKCGPGTQTDSNLGCTAVSPVCF
jgi:hypothetical protein